MSTEKDVRELVIVSEVAQLAGRAFTMYDKITGEASGLDSQAILNYVDDEVIQLAGNIQGAINLSLSTPFTEYHESLKGILDIEIKELSQTYLKYGVEYFWRNANGFQYYIRLKGWNGSSWATIANWERSTAPPTTIERVDVLWFTFIIDWSLVPDGTNFSGLAEIKNTNYFVQDPPETFGNMSYDTFPYQAAKELLGIEFFEILDAIEGKKYYISTIENNADYRRFYLNYCDADGSNAVNLYSYIVLVGEFTPVTELSTEISGHKLSFRIRWANVVNAAGLTKDTGGFLTTVYNKKYIPQNLFLIKNTNYDVFGSEVSESLRGITFAKVIGNTVKDRVFYIEAAEVNPDYRRFWIGHSNLDGTGYVRDFNHIIWAVDFVDQQRLELTGNGLTLIMEVDWTLMTNFGGGTHLTSAFLKSVYFPSIGASFNNSGYAIKDNIATIISVDGLGNGDFTTLEDAYASITDSAIDNQYEIVVYPGTYIEMDLKPPKFTHTHGAQPNTVIITSLGLGGTLPIFDQQYGSSKLSNMKLISDTGYCIHYDVGLDAETLMNENLHLVKITNGAIIGGGSYRKGTLFYWKNCIFENGGAACHTNVNQNYSNVHLVFEDCKLINAIIQLGSVGGFGHNVCEVRGLSTIKGNVSITTWNSPLRSLDLPNTYFGNNVEWQLIGGNNKNFLPQLGSTGECLQFETNNFSEVISSVSGTAANLIFGIVKYKGGNTRIKSTATGIYMVKDQQAGLEPYSTPADVYQLWKRLGDCSVVNKTLSVTIGGVTQTYTFTANYLVTQTAEATIIAAINTVITNATLKKYAPNAWENIATAESQFVTITQTDGIIAGEFVTELGERCLENEIKENVYGIALDSGIMGEQIQVWTGNIIEITGVEGEYGIGSTGVLSIGATEKIGYIKQDKFIRY